MKSSIIPKDHLSKAAWGLKPEYFSQIMTTKELQETMLKTGGKYMINGELYKLKSAKMCPGIYEVTIKLVIPK